MNLVTGATGLLGTHLCEQLIARGEQVRALARPSSDVSRLRELGVEIVLGDLGHLSSVSEAAVGAEIVYHCAAKLGDWGRWSDFHAGNVLTTRNVVQACESQDVRRLLHVSSVAAYGNPTMDGGDWTEDTPLGQNPWMWDHYARAKIEAEAEARQFRGETTIVRPTWIYGPGDRMILPRMVKALRRGRVAILGRGGNLLNLVHAEDVARGAILAAHDPASAGETYNLSSRGEITQREFFDLLCRELDLPPVKRHAPLKLAFTFAYICEAAGKATGRRTPPQVTRRGISLISRPTHFNSDKARERLGWTPQVDIHDGLRRTLQWLLAAEAAAV
jgi:2-alkyl-3-oxoalkanoate reductase